MLDCSSSCVVAALAGERLTDLGRVGGSPGLILGLGMSAVMGILAGLQKSSESTSHFSKGYGRPECLGFYITCANLSTSF